MSDTIRQRIVDAVKARFAGITKANQYFTDIGNSVVVCRAVDPETAELPVLNVWDTDRESKAVAAGVHEHTLTVTAQLVAAGSGVDKFIRLVEADISKAIGVDRNWGGLAFYTMITKSGFGANSSGERILGGYWFEFIIKYRTKGFNETELV